MWCQFVKCADTTPRSEDSNAGQGFAKIAQNVLININPSDNKEKIIDATPEIEGADDAE